MRKIFQSGTFAMAIVVLTISVGADNLSRAGWFQILELRAYDHLVRNFAATASEDPPITLIRIHEQDLQRFRYPISDGTLAEALEILSSMNPSSIGVDIFRDLQTEGYHRLANIVTKSPEIVLISKQLGDIIQPPPFLENSDQTGFADLKQDLDAVIRRGILFVWKPEEEQQTYLSFPLQLALHHLKKESITLTATPEDNSLVRLGEATIQRFQSSDGGYRNADDGGYQFLLNFNLLATPFLSYSLSDVIDKKIPQDQIQGKIVIIGSTSASIHDRYETPLSNHNFLPMYGIEIQALITNQLVSLARGQSQALRTVDDWIEYGWMVLCTLLGCLAGRRTHSTIALLAAATASLVFPTFISALLFRLGWWLPLAGPALACFLGFLAILIWTSLKNVQERRLIMQIFGTYVPTTVAVSLWSQRNSFLDGGKPKSEKLFVTVMITDLKGYTSALEQMDPTDIMEWINSYMSSMTKIVEEHGGIVEDYAGDGLKANFGVPIPSTSPLQIKKDAQGAVDCALAMSKELGLLNRYWESRGLPNERLRIGICTGPTIAGSIGSMKRMAYTTIGDTVNVAARLESFDKEGFDSEPKQLSRILISASTWQYLDPDYPTVCAGAHILKGRHEPVLIYHVQSRNLTNTEENILWNTKNRVWPEY